MEGARIAIFDDDPEIQEQYPLLLRIAGHEIISSGVSVEEATDQIDSLEPGSVDVFLVDGDFKTGTGDTSEGEALIDLIRSKFGEVAIIGTSGHGAIKGADKNLTKEKVSEILNYIDEL